MCRKKSVVKDTPKKSGNKTDAESGVEQEKLELKVSLVSVTSHSAACLGLALTKIR